MRTDELHDDQEVDRALRELLPPMPRSRAWERAMRDDVLRYITSGAVPAQNGSAVLRDPEVELAIEHGNIERRSRRPMRRALIGVAAAVVLVVGLVPRWLNTEPATETPDDVGTTSPAVPSLPPPALRPDRFGLVPDGDPRTAVSTAFYGGQIGWNNPTSAEALVARIEGDTMTEAVQLQALSTFDDSTIPIATTQAVTIGGTAMTLYAELGTPTLRTVVLPGTPTLAATGLDPVSFLEASGGFPISGARLEADGEVTFAVGDLPTGYQIVVPPAGMPLGSFSAMTRAPDGDGADGVIVEVDVHNPLVGFAVLGDMRRVDVNGVAGWMRDEGPGSPVIWHVSDTTWALVAGATTSQAALDFARALTFVDEATWRARYNLPEPDLMSRDEELRPPPSTLPEPTELIVGRRTVEADTPAVTPVGCSSVSYTDNTVAAPVAAPDQELALTEFLSTPSAKSLLQLGYEEVLVKKPLDHYRFEVRNNIGQLVTVIFVDALGSGWAATRWQASPC